jgi:hypothetical protein
MAYIGQSLTEGTRRAYTFVATAGQTTFNAVYGVGAVDVYQNGILLQPSDYNSSSGSSVVLGVGAAVNDEITIIAHNTFSVADTVSSSQGGTFAGNVQFDGSFTSKGIDDNADATAITIDSSENVKLETGNLQIKTTGQIEDNGTRLLCRSTGDASGLRFDGASYTPFKNGSVANGTVDLGYGSGRYKDLYLSGGAYIGGTGAANKLDDYEEGTFTGTLIGYYGNPSSAVTTTGYYTKVGNSVDVYINFEGANTSGAAGDMWITGLPFSHSGPYAVLSTQMNAAGTYPNSSPFGLIAGAICYFYKHVSNGNVTAVAHNAGTNRSIRVTGNYRVA